jgi:periplasmic protein TonB
LTKKAKNKKTVSKTASDSSNRVWRNTPKFNKNIIYIALILSLFGHLYSGFKLDRYTNSQEFLDAQKQKLPPVKIKIVEKPKDPPKKILEAPQKKTEKPVDATHAGVVDHKTEKETKISKKKHRVKAANAGVKGNPKAKGKKKQKIAHEKPKEKKQTKKRTGKTGFEPIVRKPRNAYEAMLPSSIADLAGELDAGFQDYVDDKIEEGDRIDINTTEYRFIGYFTNMRKAIELVWIYPSAASRRGMQGKVGIEFLIHKNGKKSRIKIVRSSGYKLLDEAIKNAIQDATFAPLPTSFNKERLLVTGNFTYVLNSYGTH